MPSLTLEDRAALLGPVSWTCEHCGQHPTKNYCRSHDEFYLLCGCTRRGDLRHQTCRIYLWTVDGIKAIPNFDLT